MSRPFTMEVAKLLFKMSQNLLCWNVCGLNGRARRDVVRTMVAQQNVSVVCLQETKLSQVCTPTANEILGADLVSTTNVASFSVTVPLCPAVSPSRDSPWPLTVVYGPQGETEKVEFLDELRALRPQVAGPWFLCGDWNMIYRSQDKNNNGRLNRRSMRRLRSFVDQLRL